MGGVTVAKRLERLVRFVPGIPGYQDRETARATDKQVRMRLVGELQRLIHGLEEDKERIAGSRDLSSLPRLDRRGGLGRPNAMSPIRMEVMGWFDKPGPGIVQRYPGGGWGDIKRGAQLTVRENQAGVFSRDAQGLAVFGPGRHTLSTQNLPILT